MDGEDTLASSAFIPLPFRALGLVGLGLACWATNLHLLHFLGVDTADVLEVRPDKLPTSSPPSPKANGLSHSPSQAVRTSASAALYPPIYRLLFVYVAWIVAAYVAFKTAIGGDMHLMDSSKAIITLATVGAIIGLFCPLNILQRRERWTFLVAVKRCLLASSSKPVYFCDIILADIFTSFAKVLGDSWVAAIMLVPGGSLSKGAMDLHGWTEWMIPVLISLPFAIRFRQCVAEYKASGYSNTRPLYNAIKYASSFPVIFLSAMEKVVQSDNAKSQGSEQPLHSTWHGENGVFRLWLFSLIVSSAYSFWWDVTNDWGLDLLRPTPAIQLPPSRSMSPFLDSSSRGRRSKSAYLSDLPIASPSPSPHPYIYLSQPTPASPHYHPYGLRPILLYRYPTLYYVAIAINLILRFTWSMKLSPHLYSFAELEAGVFVVEACELLRRWLWVFFRVEWEVVRREMMAQSGGMEMTTPESFNDSVSMDHSGSPS